MSLKVEIRKSLPGFELEAEFCCEKNTLGLLDGSGSGKSMTLKCIAGLMQPDEGHIELNGKVFYDSASRINLSPQQRKTGYLFQNYALFPNMTVERNLLCGMRKHAGFSEMRTILSRFHLIGLEKRYPHELSGGQQQRVALARMIVSKPQVLMLDEPFSALDAFLREEMQLTVAQVLREFSGMTLIVSHDRDEIYRLCDSIAIYDCGRVVRIGERKKVFSQPQNRAAAVLTGCRNVLPAKAVDEQKIFVNDWGVILETAEQMAGTVTAVGVRAHYFRTVEREGQNTLACSIHSVVESPFEMIIYLVTEGGKEKICWKTDKQTFLKYKDREKILLYVPAEAVLPLYG